MAINGTEFTGPDNVRWAEQGVERTLLDIIQRLVALEAAIRRLEVRGR